ncbi:MAG TPA: flagellar motor protein MotD [Steroidobacteraceae bacterium]|nr:flagellar motor protein MotD [Steroidobacteraceae bacterium]
MARRKRHEEHQNHESWAIPYADLMTLLLAFFVVMYAISSVNEGKYRVLSDSIVAAFRGTPMTLEPVQAGSKQIGQGADISMSIVRQVQVEGQPRDLLTPIPLREENAEQGRPAAANQAFAQQFSDGGSGKTLEQVAASVEEAMRELIDRGMVAVRRKRDTVEVEIRTDILFPSGQSTLTPSARGIIERIGDALIPFPNALNVEGHTDDRPINTALFPSNWELSAARAASVVHLLTQRGIAPGRLTVIGYAEQQPLRSNATAEGRNANRRVLLVIRGTPEVDAVQLAAAAGH